MVSAHIYWNLSESLRATPARFHSSKSGFGPVQAKEVERRSTRSPSRVDELVGEKVRIARVAANLSMEELAREVGVTWQQIQKYEVGANRIGAGRLHEIARVLSKPIEFFFDFNDGLVSPRPEGVPRVINEKALKAIQIILKVKSERVLGDIAKVVDVMSRYDETVST